jgi:hypothetical protein
MTFPSNNLPTASRNWAREVEKKVTNLESSFRSAEVNNVTRDSQLSVTANTALSVATVAQQAATDANNAINGLISLGSDGSSYDVAAGNITAGTVSGLNVVGGTLSTSGARHVEISGTQATFYDNSGAFSGRVTAAEDGRAATLYIGTGVSGVFMYNGGLELEANGLVQVTGGNGFHSAGPISTDSNLTVDGSLTVGSFNPSSISTGSITASSLTVGTSQVNSTSIYGQSVTGDSVGGGFANFTGSVTGQSGVSSGGALTRTQLAGGGTTGASITDGGNFVRTSSSARYKTDIQDLDIAYETVLSLQPKKFRRKDEVESRGDEARYYPGFIAEDLAGTGMDIFAFYEKLEDGSTRPDGIHYAELTAALISALKHQDQLIKDLTARIEALESR